MESSQRGSEDFEVGREGRRSNRVSGAKSNRIELIEYFSASAHFVLHSSPKVNCNEPQY